MSRQIQDYNQLLKLVALCKLMSLIIYLNVEKREEYLSLFIIYEVYYLSLLDSAFIVGT